MRYVAKKAPEGLIMLKPNGDNIIPWTNAYAGFCEMKYGTIASFIRNNDYPERSVLTAEALLERFPGTAAATITKMMVENMTTVMKQESKDKESKFEMFAIMESVVTDEGWNRVKSRNGFAAALAAKCPLLLMRLVTMEHSLKMNNVSDDEAKYIAEDRYHRISMGPVRTLAEYFEVFNMAVTNMNTLGCVGVPEEARQARHFLMKMDRVRYGGYMRDILNDDRSGVRAIPATKQAIVDGARMHIPSQMMKTNVEDRQSMPMVYQLSAAQLRRPCHNCQKLGHWANTCPEPDHRKEEKSEGNAYHVEAEEVEEECEGEETMFGYAFKVSAGTTSALHPREVALDTFANIHFFCNKDLLSGIRSTNMSVKGFTGAKNITKVGDVSVFGEAVFAPWTGVNGLAMCIVEDKCEMAYFQKDRIEARLSDDLVLIFAYKPQLGCYACMFTDEIINKLTEHETRFKYCNITIASEMEKEYSTKEVVAARRARTMMRRLYYPADSALIRTITKGALVECDTTGRDVVLATDIYGRDVASMKGKAKDIKPKVYPKMLVPTMSQKEQTVYADVFHWRKVDFVIFIVKPLRLVMVQWLPKLDEPNARAAILTLCNKLESRGYSVSEIVVDPAKALVGLTGTVSKNITVVGSRMHVADAEVEIRTVKERVRSSMHGLPYDTPLRLVRWQVYGAVMTYNMILRQGQTVSARELFTGVKTNYQRDVRAEFGEYVQAYVSPGDMKKNGSQERTVGAIALCSADNQRGTFWFLSLKNASFFRADRWTSLPITDDVIALMNKMHDEDLPSKVNMSALQKRRNRRMRMNPSAEERDMTRELLELPTEREHVVETLQPATEMANPVEEAVLQPAPEVTELDDDADGTREDVDGEHVSEAEARLREYTEALERVKTAQSELDEFMRQQDTPGESEDMEAEESLPVESTHTEEDDVSAHEEDADEDETTMEDPYDNFTEILDASDRRRGVPLGARTVGGRRMSHRIDNRRRAEDKISHAYRLTVKKALKQNEQASRKSIMKELGQIVEKDVWEIVDKSKLTKTQLRRVIRSSMFLTEKFTASGEFDKLKARLVAGGDGQDKTLYGNLSSPTVSQETVMMVLAIAAIEGRRVTTIDITGAYLECLIDDNDEVIMTIDPFLATLLAQIDPTVEQMKDEKGVIHVKLKKALYGCVQSAKLWYDKLCTVLEADGYVKNGYDECLFNKTVDGVQCTVAFHVDDLLITCADQVMIDAMEKMLKDNFTAITINKGDKHSYLAMNMEVDKTGIRLDMIAYIKKCLEGRNIGRKASSPATDDLFDVPEDGVPLGEDERKTFHSDVAKLLYLAKRTRGQILTAVSHLSGRVKGPTDDDQRKLDRVFAYLSGTVDEVMHLKLGGVVDPEVYIDASYGVHSDGSSRTGMVIMLAGVAIGCWSSKQKLVTKSSTEAEIVALSDGLTNAIWMREMVMAQGYKLGPTKIFEDNQGVIKIIQSGRSPKHRTRHLNVRHFFARDREKSGDIVMIYKPTDEMIADIMTKPVTGGLFEKLSSKLAGSE
mgnify:CR=1 FL=1